MSPHHFDFCSNSCIVFAVIVPWLIPD